MTKKVNGRLLIVTLILFFVVLTLGTATVLVSSSRTPISKCQIDLKKKEFSYTGSKIQTDLTISHDGQKLKNNEDYVLSYDNNVGPGNGHIRIRGIGIYRGHAVVPFKITVEPIRDLAAKYVPDGDKSSIDVSWEKSGNCDYYLVRYKHTADKDSDTDKKTEKAELHKTKESSYRIQDVDHNGEYEISVSAVAGKHGTLSSKKTVSVTIEPLKKPVISDVASPGAGRIDVSWEPVPNAQEYIVSEVSDSNGDVNETIVPAENTSVAFLGKIMGNSYTYTVKASTTIDGKKYESKPSDSKTASPAKPMVGQATRGDGGRLRGGRAGDQSGGECDVANWSYSSKNGSFNNWKYVARFKDEQKAIIAAEAMEAACKNNNIGYDQAPDNGRGELKDLVEANGWDMSLVNDACETSCSPLVGACISCTGIDFPVPGSTGDSDFYKPLRDSGEFEILTDEKYLTTDKYLQQGDILVSPGRHTCMVI